jgi:hypothetical protein
MSRKLKKVAAKKTKTLEVEAIEEKPFFWNFILENGLRDENNIYSVYLPPETKILDAHCFERASMAGHLITDFKEVWDVPYLSCERPSAEHEKLIKRRFIIKNLLDIAQVNAYEKTQCIASFQKQGSMCVEKYMVFELL